MELQARLQNLTKTSSLPELQAYVEAMVQARGFEDETLQEVMILLTEEIGELAKEVRKSSAMKLDVSQDRQGDMAGEIADVFMYLLAMCRIADIDLFEAFKAKEIKNCQRVWQ